MSKFTFDQPAIRLYKYYFHGISDPVVIQAHDKFEARRILQGNYTKLGVNYQNSKIIGETVSVPVFGVTQRSQGGVEYVWVGMANSANGWMPKPDFEKKYGKID